MGPESTSKDSLLLSSPKNLKTSDLKILANAFIERDYSDGESRKIKFREDGNPKRLLNRIENELLRSSIGEINLIFDQLNENKFSYFLESIFLMLTCFITGNEKINLTAFKKTLDRVTELIDQQNKEIFIPRGLQLLNPHRTGFRNLQIVVYDISEYLPKQNKKKINTPEFKTFVTRNTTAV